MGSILPPIAEAVQLRDKRPTRAEKQWTAAQERFEAEDEPPTLPPYQWQQALFEIRLILWLSFAMLCIIAWRVW